MDSELQAGAPTSDIAIQSHPLKAHGLPADKYGTYHTYQPQQDHQPQSWASFLRQSPNT
jgi:hypothetical protein